MLAVLTPFSNPGDANVSPFADAGKGDVKRLLPVLFSF